MSDIPDDDQRHINQGDDYTHFTGDDCPKAAPTNNQNSLDAIFEEYDRPSAKPYPGEKLKRRKQAIAAINKTIMEDLNELLDNAKTATTQGGVHMVATYELRQQITKKYGRADNEGA